METKKWLTKIINEEGVIWKIFDTEDEAKNHNWGKDFEPITQETREVEIDPFVLDYIIYHLMLISNFPEVIERELKTQEKEIKIAFEEGIKEWTSSPDADNLFRKLAKEFQEEEN